MSSLLSIVIPTKNRYHTLEYLVKLLISYRDNRIEIVIQDNSDDNSSVIPFIKEIVSSESNVRYFYDPEKISISKNIDNGVNNSTGDFICVLGDDDAVTHSIINCVNYMKENEIDSINFPATYYVWPGVKSNNPYIDYTKGLLSIPHATGEIKEINQMEELKKCLYYGAKSLGNMPKVYHGIVRRSVLSLLYYQTGSYFPGPSPDMANAVALCFYVKRHAYYDQPVMIHGHSVYSTGGLGRSGKHIERDLSKLNFLGADINRVWDDTIPKIWTAETVYAVSLFESLKRIKKESFIKNFNYSKFYANYLRNHPQFLWSLVNVKNKNYLKTPRTIFVLITLIPFVLASLAPDRLRNIYRKLMYLNSNKDSNIKVTTFASNIIESVNKLNGVENQS